VVRGQTRAEARWGLVTIVALDRLERELNKLGWTEVENYIDEAEFVVARDRSGRRWGIGVSDDDAVTRAWILDQIRLEDEIDVAVVLDYRDLVADGQIQMARPRPPIRGRHLLPVDSGGVEISGASRGTRDRSESRASADRAR
jgi:hypothetical protein